MALDFPNSPSVNDSFSAGGKTWVYNGTKWVLLGVSLNQTVADGAITAAKLASDSVTSAKIAAGAVGTTDLAANAVTQAKLAANVSGITITTTANRDTDIPSPFTAQFCFLTDTNLLQRYTGSAWIVAIASAPAAPTALSGTALGPTSVSIAFTPGAENGSTITNYQYALSTDSGSTYGSFVALDPADATSPITISGLSAGTTYTIKLKAVNTMGAGTESAGVSVTTLSLLVDYLVVAGGGGASGYNSSGGGGAGGFRTNVIGATSGRNSAAENSLTLTPSTSYPISIGAGGVGNGPSNGGELSGFGANSVFGTITSTGGGLGGNNFGTYPRGGSGGSGGGSRADTVPNSTGGLGTAGQGFDGGSNTGYYSGNYPGGGGGGAGANGGTVSNITTAGNGGVGLQNPITGSTIGQVSGGLYYLAGGGGGSAQGGGTSGTGGLGGGGNAGSGASGNFVGTSGTINTGGGGGAGNTATGGNGGSGVVILRYNSAYTITLGAGLTGSTATDGSSKVTTITAGSGNVSWA